VYLHLVAIYIGASTVWVCSCTLQVANAKATSRSVGVGYNRRELALFVEDYAVVAGRSRAVEDGMIY
jgi:hypothetical protein